ncbi:MAG: CinA family protein [Lachnospiraceae bacterium]|nr:CinA family protein [Lachnospiraceae bacterium]
MCHVENYGLEVKIIDLLKRKNWYITTAESCTGGLIGATLVNVPGASKVFQEGYITYSNEAKMKLLGVRSETLERWGAVSEETALEMAKGAALAAGCQVGISATGIAGPDGGTPEKPVGLVYIGCYIDGHQSVLECRFCGSRLQNRESTVTNALELLYDELTSF